MKNILIGIVAGVILLVLAVIAYLIPQYNGLVEQSQGVEKQWAQVENVYQRRADLIPNLVATVSGAADFEKTTLTAITEARSKVGQIKFSGMPDASGFQAFEKAQGELSSALSRLMVVIEKYPDLKATQNFSDLQAQLEGTENRIAVERGRFNEAVQNYNTAIKKFPAVLYAGFFNFHERPYFRAVTGAEVTPKVDFKKP